MKFKPGTFVTVPNKQHLEGLSPRSQTVYFWLCSHMDADGMCFPSAAKLAKECGMGRATVFLALTDLEKKNLISRKEKFDRRGQVSNEYQVMIIEDSQPSPESGRTEAESPDSGLPRLESGHLAVQNRDSNYIHITKSKGTKSNILVKDKKPSVSHGTGIEGEITNDMIVRICTAANKLFPNTPPDYGHRGMRKKIVETLKVRTADDYVAVIEEIQKRVGEPFFPGIGSNVSDFIMWKLPGCENALKRQPSPSERLLRPYKATEPNQKGQDFGKLVLANKKRKEAGLPLYKSIDELHADQS